jgi:hypothetical protein
MDGRQILTKLRYLNREVVVDGSADLVGRSSQMLNAERNYIGMIRLPQLRILVETIRCRRTGIDGTFVFGWSSGEGGFYTVACDAFPQRYLSIICMFLLAMLMR